MKDMALDEGIKSWAASAFGGAGVEDNVEIILECAATVVAGLVLWKHLPTDVLSGKAI